MSNDFAFTLVIVALFLIISLSFSCITEIFNCSQAGKYLDQRTEWHLGVGCVVEKPDGSKVLLRQMRDMER